MTNIEGQHCVMNSEIKMILHIHRWWMPQFWILSLYLFQYQKRVLLQGSCKIGVGWLNIQEMAANFEKSKMVTAAILNLDHSCSFDGIDVFQIRVVTFF